MPHRTLPTLLALVASTAGGALLAGSAPATAATTVQGVVVDNDAFPDLLDHAEVTLTDGNVAFRWSNAVVTPRLTATLHIVEGDDACYRVRTDSFDAAGQLVGRAVDLEDGHCPRNDDATDIPVDMQAIGGPDVRRVQVSVQKQVIEVNKPPKWQSKDTSSLPYLTTHDDEVRILGSGLDVGGETWLTGAPTDAARVSWAIGDDGRLTATYTGFLHMKGFGSDAGRVVIRAINPFLDFTVATTEGGSHIPADNGHYAYEDTLAVTSSNGSDLQVATQSLSQATPDDPAVWQDSGTQTVNVAE
jgi:hypothetical protein